MDGDAKRLAVVSTWGMHLWDLANGKERRYPLRRVGQWRDLSPDGRLLVHGPLLDRGKDFAQETVGLLDVTTGQERVLLPKKSVSR